MVLFFYFLCFLDKKIHTIEQLEYSIDRALKFQIFRLLMV